MSNPEADATSETDVTPVYQCPLYDCSMFHIRTEQPTDSDFFHSDFDHKRGVTYPNYPGWYNVRTYTSLLFERSKLL